MVSGPNSRSRRVTLLKAGLLLANFIVADVNAGVLIAFLSTLVLFVSMVFVGQSTNAFDISKLTIFGAWYLSYLALTYLPSFFVYADQSGPYRGRYLFAVHSALIFVPLGVLLTDFVLGTTKEQSNRYFNQPLRHGTRDTRLMLACRFLLIGLLALTGCYLLEVRTIPLFYFVRHPEEYLELVLLREESFKLLDSPLMLLYYLAKMLLYPYLAMIALGGYLVTRNSRWLRIFLAGLAAGLFFASLTLAKAPVASLVFLLVVFVYFYRGRRLRLKWLIPSLIALLAFPIGLLIIMGDISITTAIEGLAGRIFYLPAEILYYYFEVFPTHVGFLHGRSISHLASLLGVQFFSVENYVGLYMFPLAPRSISAPASFLGYLYADFGLPGVIVGAFIAGLTMASVHTFFLRRPKTIATVAAYAFLVYSFVYLNATALPIVLASNGALLSILLTWLLDWYAGRDRREATIHLSGGGVQQSIS